LDPVIFPIAESAYFEVWAAVLLAKVSGRDVPRATIVIALIEAGIPRTHPNKVAVYSTIAVIRPIIARAIKNAGAPL
jgi:hypothetical protein